MGRIFFAFLVPGWIFLAFYIAGQAKTETAFFPASATSFFPSQMAIPAAGFQVAPSLKSPNDIDPPEQLARFALHEERKTYSQGPITDDQVMIMSLGIGNRPVSEAAMALVPGNTLQLPLSELMRALEFPVEVNAGTGTAAGWFIREENTFSLDVAESKAILRGETKQFDSSRVTIFENEIFVDVRLLSTWFPLNFKSDFSKLWVEIEPTKPLPFQERQRREKLRERLLRDEGPKKEYPEAKSPRRAFGFPGVDVNTDYTFSRADNGSTSLFRFDVLLSADVLYLDGSMFLSGNQKDGLNQIRFSLSRKDPNGNIGGLGLTEIGLGDIFTPQVPLVARIQLGRGVSFSNFPVNRPTEFDRLTLTGDLPFGWEVELFRNEVLLGFQTPTGAGQYVFEDIPLLFGKNQIKLVFYGPQGQVREEVREVRVGPGQIRPGEHKFRFSANQQGELLLLEKQGFDSDPFLNTRSDGKMRLFAEYYYGVSESLSLGTSFSSLQTSDGVRRNYGSLNLMGSVGGVFGRLNFVNDFNGGWAGRISAQTSLVGRTQLFIEHTHLENFVSEQFQFAGGRLKDRTDIRIDGFFNAFKSQAVNFTFRTIHDRFVDGFRQTRLSSQFSTLIDRFTVTNSLNVNFTGGNRPRDTTFNGNFLIGGYLGRLRVRGQLNYTLSDSFSFSNSTLTADYTLNKYLTARANLNLDLTGDGVNVFGAGLATNPRTFPVNLGMNVQYATNQDLQVRMTMSFSFGFDPRPKTRPKLIHQGHGRLGAVSVRVFVDKNLNGIFDSGDEPVNNAGFRLGRGLIREYTNESGAAFITGLPLYRKEVIKIREETIHDPFLIPSAEAFEIVPRPGSVTEINFPLVETGEIDGVILMKRGPEQQPLSNVTVKLVKKNGDIVKTTRTAFDGFYLFDLVPPGQYSVRVSGKSVEKLGIKGNFSQKVMVRGGDDNILSGVDFIITREDP